MYLVPKNIKVKREIFKGFGILEIGVVAISLAVGYVLSLSASAFYYRLFFFSILPLSTFILLIPLPNGSTALNILIKLIKYKKNQKQYKKYN